MIHKTYYSKGNMSKICLLLSVVISWLAVGCTAPTLRSLPDTSIPKASSTPQMDQGWWFIRFRIDRPDDETRWERDLLLAHRVVAPILISHQKEINLWRFHRRSSRDGTGHQLSFLFYTSARVADSINRGVLSDPLVERLQSARVIQEVLIDAVDHNDRPDIGDTSDPKWSPVIKDTWPYYIMGVSRMWLEMINQISRQTEMESDPSLETLLSHYRQVNEAVTNKWQEEGYHALLHHLNAIYGYAPMVYWEKRWKSF